MPPHDGQIAGNREEENPPPHSVHLAVRGASSITNVGAHPNSRVEATPNASVRASGMMPVMHPTLTRTHVGVTAGCALRVSATIRAIWTAMVISCIGPSGLEAEPALLRGFDLPLLTHAGPGEIVWRNPAGLARTPGVRLFVRVDLPRADQPLRFRSAGGATPLGFGLPLFCTADIPPIARLTGVDSTLAAALVAVESGFNPRAVSPTGARGLTQLTSRTARSLGVYNRHWPGWNLWGGLTYLAELRRRFGDDDLALAAYNVGPGTVQRKGRAILSDPAVASYVASVSRLRKAYATRYPSRCVHGGNGLAVAYAESAASRIGVVGWGVDLHAFLEVGASVAVWQEGDSTRGASGLAGARAYVLDPVLVAGTYRWDDRTWEVGALLALSRERVLLAAERDREGSLVVGLKVALPLSVWIETKATRELAMVAASIETPKLAFAAAHVASLSRKGAGTMRQSLSVSLGRLPSL